MVPDWIKVLARDWGGCVRRFEAQLGQISGTLGRIHEEGVDGAAIRSHAQKLPIVDFPKDIQQFHRAWLDLEPPDQNIIWLDAKVRMPFQEKWAAMNMKKDSYYRARRSALMKIAETIDYYE